MLLTIGPVGSGLQGVGVVPPKTGHDDTSMYYFELIERKLFAKNIDMSR